MLDKFPDKMTIGDKYKPAMRITSQDVADEYFVACVEHGMRFGKTRQEAEEIERSNLGYIAGYYDTETRIRVERLFGCAHPVFGKAKNGTPTAEEAFEMGKTLATKGGQQ